MSESAGIATLAAEVGTKARALELTLGADWATGTLGKPTIKARARDHRRFQEQLERILRGDSPTIPVDPSQYQGSGPYPGPCLACGGPCNSWFPLCETCRGYDDNHYIDADGTVRRIAKRKKMDLDKLSLEDGD